MTSGDSCPKAREYSAGSLKTCPYCWLKGQDLVRHEVLYNDHSGLPCDQLSDRNLRWILFK